MRFEIIPYLSVGLLSFDDSRVEIRKKLNKNFVQANHEFNGIKESIDYFEDIDFKAIYDEYGKVDAFEFYINAQSPIFNGIELLTERFVNLIQFFSELDPSLEKDVYEFTSYQYGIGAHMDYSNEADIACADSIIVFRQGYYDQLK